MIFYQELKCSLLFLSSSWGMWRRWCTLTWKSKNSYRQMPACWRSGRSWPTWSGPQLHRWTAETRPTPTGTQTESVGSCWEIPTHPANPAALPLYWMHSREPGIYRFWGETNILLHSTEISQLLMQWKGQKKRGARQGTQSPKCNAKSLFTEDMWPRVSQG